MNNLRKKYINVQGKCIYVVENEHGAVKIGVSQNVSGRIKVLSKQGGFKPINVYHTKMCSNGYEIENKIHKRLEAYRIDGEWFKLSFNDAVKVVTDIFECEAKFQVKKQRCIMPEDIERLFNMV